MNKEEKIHEAYGKALNKKANENNMKVIVTFENNL